MEFELTHSEISIYKNQHNYDAIDVRLKGQDYLSVSLATNNSLQFSLGNNYLV